MQKPSMFIGVLIASLTVALKIDGAQQPYFYGKTLTLQVGADGLVLADEPANAYLRRIGQSLIPRGLVLERVSWKFRALRDPQPNAFALPNGSIYVTTGLMTLLDNESQLAAIIAHELTPGQAASMDIARIIGCATDAGGRTSHSSIVAAALGIPVVVGCQRVTRQVNDGDTVIIDGKNGLVIVRPDSETVAEYEAEKADLDALVEELTGFLADYDDDGRLDVFVSNAATGVIRDLDGLDARAWEWTMDANARALFLGAKRAVSLMERGGSIVSLSSQGATRETWQHPQGVVETEKLIGARIKNAEGKDLGEIDGLLVSEREGKVSHVIVGRGGVAGIGETKVVVPWSDVKLRWEGNNPVVSIDASVLDRAPRYERRQASGDRDRGTPSASPATSPSSGKDMQQK